ncbi:unnamed protein product [Pleuronectes platessa]|uniref:Uncharacterized protein n=1 Tax=Pleuronectes platessa TaxID=8262 RepID=A0A9N7VHB1_PLEPL|nr:unnamed protein product [Pleuronectes platessa]
MSGLSTLESMSENGSSYSSRRGLARWTRLAGRSQISDDFGLGVREWGRGSPAQSDQEHLSPSMTNDQSSVWDFETAASHRGDHRGVGNGWETVEDEERDATGERRAISLVDQTPVPSHELRVIRSLARPTGPNLNLESRSGGHCSNCGARSGCKIEMSNRPSLDLPLIADVSFFDRRTLCPDEGNGDRSLDSRGRKVRECVPGPLCHLHKDLGMWSQASRRRFDFG